MITKYENREVEIIDIEHGVDYCDSYIIEAQYLDTGELLNDGELDELTELCQDILYDEWNEKRQSDAYDTAKDLMKYGE